MGFLARLMGRNDTALVDGGRLYMALLKQSRQPEFYGQGRVPDSYEGRIEVLTLHMVVVIARLRQMGEQGERLSQAVFDAMVDDFDIALREEGLTDSGVKRRIKPIVQLFYTRLKAYDASVDDDPDSGSKMWGGIMPDADQGFLKSLNDYRAQFAKGLDDKTLGQIAKAAIVYPKIV